MTSDLGGLDCPPSLYCSGQVILATVSPSVPPSEEPAFPAQKYVAAQGNVRIFIRPSFARSSTSWSFNPTN